MSSRRVLFTATARAHIQRERDWWLGNRRHVTLFAQEIEDAIRVVASLPGAGTPYPAPAVPGLRRFYIRKLGCHLYFTFDGQEVIVRALSGARRRRGPLIPT